MRQGAFELDAFDGSILAQARSVMDWNQRYVFCPSCGSKTVSKESGYKRVCESEACVSYKSVQNYSHVRTDSVWFDLNIVNVLSPDGSKILLGRQKSWPPLRYSCVAGFIEPGETIEECCAREVLEETGVSVADVTYVSSQPWPFPSQLMIGCFAKASTEVIDIMARDKELEDAKWFSRADVAAALKEESKTLKLPPDYAIAHMLIKHWIDLPSAKI